MSSKLTVAAIRQRNAHILRVVSQGLRYSRPGVQLANDGFVTVDSVLRWSELSQYGVTSEELIAAALSDVLGRLDVVEDDDGTPLVRALYGHSSDILKAVTIPFQDFVPASGTHAVVELTAAKWERVRYKGLFSKRKHHIVLYAPDLQQSLVLAEQRKSGREVRIWVDVKKAQKDGISFFVTPNGVILTAGEKMRLPTKYFHKVLQISTDKPVPTSAYIQEPIQIDRTRIRAIVVPESPTAGLRVTSSSVSSSPSPSSQSMDAFAMPLYSQDPLQQQPVKQRPQSAMPTMRSPAPQMRPMSARTPSTPSRFASGQESPLEMSRSKSRSSVHFADTDILEDSLLNETRQSFASMERPSSALERPSSALSGSTFGSDFNGSFLSQKQQRDVSFGGLRSSEASFTWQQVLEVVQASTELLRHGLSALKFDDRGYVSLSAVASARKPMTQYSQEVLVQMYQADKMGRIEVYKTPGSGEILVRALFGHSFPVQIGKQVADKHGFGGITLVYLCTGKQWAWALTRGGLSIKDRNEIGLMTEKLYKDVQLTGEHEMYEVAIHLDVKKLMMDGIELWRLPAQYDRGVILTTGAGGFLSPVYFSKVVNTRTGEIIPPHTYNQQVGGLQQIVPVSPQVASSPLPPFIAQSPRIPTPTTPSSPSIGRFNVFSSLPSKDSQRPSTAGPFRKPDLSLLQPVHVQRPGSALDTVRSQAQSPSSAMTDPLQRSFRPQSATTQRTLNTSMSMREENAAALQMSRSSSPSKSETREVYEQPARPFTPSLSQQPSRPFTPTLAVTASELPPKSPSVSRPESRLGMSNGSATPSGSRSLQVFHTDVMWAKIDSVIARGKRILFVAPPGHRKSAIAKILNTRFGAIASPGRRLVDVDRIIDLGQTFQNNEKHRSRLYDDCCNLVTLLNSDSVDRFFIGFLPFFEQYIHLTNFAVIVLDVPAAYGEQGIVEKFDSKDRGYHTALQKTYSDVVLKSKATVKRLIDDGISIGRVNLSDAFVMTVYGAKTGATAPDMYALSDVLQQ